MRITDVRVRKVSKEGKMKAIVSITIDMFGSLIDRYGICWNFRSASGME